MKKTLLAGVSAAALVVMSSAAFADPINGNDVVGNGGLLNDTINDSDGSAIVTDNDVVDVDITDDDTLIINDSFKTATLTYVTVSVEDIGVAVSSNTLTQNAIQVSAQVNPAFIGIGNDQEGGGVSIGSGNTVVGSGLSTNTGFNAQNGAQSAFSVAVGDLN